MARIGIDIRKVRDYGIGTYIRNLVAGLGSAGGGHEFALLHAAADPAPDLPADMRRIVEPSRLYSLREPFSLGRTARRSGLALLHCPHYVTPFRPGCPVAVTIHDLIHLLFPQYLPNAAARFYADYFLRRAAKRCAVIFTVSEGSKRDILERLPAREERIIVTPNALDPLYREPAGAEETAECLERLDVRSPYVLCVGNNKPHKNLSTALAAFATFRRRVGREWSMVFAGSSFADPHGGAALLRQVEESALADAVQFTGYLPDPDLRALYAGASIFLFPSLYEGFGLPPLEAMAQGTPVVASNRSVMPEILGDAALLVEPDAAVLAAGMEQVAGDSVLRAGMIERGFARAALYTWEHTVNRTLAGYQRALEAA
jgi:alpha-1,3-rhamnosyl/mannosyltransferase